MSGEFGRILFEKYRLVTVRVRYYLPDYPTILAPDFIWQNYDLVPDLPAVKKFVEYWQREIEARIHSVTVAHTELISPQEFRYHDHMIDWNRPH